MTSQGVFQGQNLLGIMALTTFKDPNTHNSHLSARAWVSYLY